MFVPKPAAKGKALEQTAQIMRMRATLLGPGSAPVTVTVADGQITVTGPSEELPALKKLGAMSLATFRPVTSSSPGGTECGHPDASRPPAAPDDTLTACSADGSTKYVLGPSIVAGNGVQDAKASSGTDGTWHVDVTLDAAGAKSFADATAALAGTGGAVAITLEDTVESAPPVQSTVTNGQIQIVGGFDQAKARQLAGILTAGDIPLMLDLS